MERLPSIRDQLAHDIDELVNATERIIRDADRSGRDLTAADFQTVSENRARLDGMRSRLAELDQQATERDSATAAARRLNSGHRPVRVVRDAHVYRPDTPDGPSFFTDLYRGNLLRADPAAQERLDRHQAGTIETRDLTSGVTTGLVPPAYLVGEYAELARAHRAAANVVRNVPLPDRGMTLEVPKVATGTTVASQATENTSVSETDATASTISVPVRTIAGMQDLSRQLLERGDPAVDAIIFGDLAAAHAAEIERQVVNGSGTSGEMLGLLGTSSIISVTYTDASPTVGELLARIADGYQQIATQRYASATAIVMHPRRWAWAMKELDTTGRPLVAPTANGPTNAIAVNTTPEADGAVGTLLGLPVHLSAQIPTNLGAGTNEDRIVLVRGDDHLLAESQGGTPYQLRMDAPLAHTLTVRCVIYGFAAFTAARQPKAVAVIAGTGCATPAFV